VAELATTLHGFYEDRFEPGAVAWWAAPCEMMCPLAGLGVCGTADQLVVRLRIKDGGGVRYGCWWGRLEGLALLRGGGIFGWCVGASRVG